MVDSDSMDDISPLSPSSVALETVAPVDSDAPSVEAKHLSQRARLTGCVLCGCRGLADVQSGSGRVHWA
eukprot:7924017-Pyramimonas_sp.AAC.1